MSPIGEPKLPATNYQLLTTNMLNCAYEKNSLHYRSPVGYLFKRHLGSNDGCCAV